jgi:hypothetical protein
LTESLPPEAGGPVVVEGVGEGVVEGVGPRFGAHVGPHFGSHLGLGVVWAALLLPALYGGAKWMALLFAPTAALAALQASRPGRSSPRARPPRPPGVAPTGRRTGARGSVDGLSGLGAAAFVMAAAFGWAGLVVALVVALAAALAVLRVTRRPELVGVRPRLVRSLALAAVPGLALGAPVALRSISSRGAAPALVLCTFALVYDAVSFLVAPSAERPWEAMAAGMVGIGAVTVAVAAILVPPFSGIAPWALGLSAAVLAPLGPVAAALVLGAASAKASALRRVDTLVVLGPVWTLLALALLH